MYHICTRQMLHLHQAHSNAAFLLKTFKTTTTTSMAEAKECSPHLGHDLGNESALSGHASTASASGTSSEDMCHEVPIHDLSFDQDEFPGWSTPCREHIERPAKIIKIMASKKSCINSLTGPVPVPAPAPLFSTKGHIEHTQDQNQNMQNFCWICHP